MMRGKRAFSALVWLALSSAAQAEGGLAKSLAPHEGTLTTACIVLVVVFAGLVGWEVFDQKRESRSSLDIAKLAAAAAKKKTAGNAPSSGSLQAIDAGAGSRSFAPPPPPPPPPPPRTPDADTSGRQTPPPAASNPFAPPAGVGSTGAASTPGPAGGFDQVDSTVAFTPADSGGSGGWADLLQRVRAGEPEAASFGETPPPATEGDSSPFAMPSAPPLGAPLSGASPSMPPASPIPAEPSSSSEAWEALLKRTTTGSDGPEAPAKESDKIQLNSSFGGASPGGPSFSPPEPPKPTSSFSLPSGSESGPAASSFSLPSAGGPPPPPAPPSFSLSSGEAASAAPSDGGFKLPGATPPAAPSSSPFSLPGAGAEPPAPPMPGPPAFKLPGSESAPAAGGFQLPGQPASSPFESGFGGGFDDPSSTLPLSDMFSNAGGSTPAFQLPSAGQSGGPSPFDFGGDHDAAAGRTISLDFSQHMGQTPPPPHPKTEG